MLFYVFCLLSFCPPFAWDVFGAYVYLTTSTDFAITIRASGTLMSFTLPDCTAKPVLFKE